MTHNFTNPPALHDPTPMGYSHSARVPKDAELVLISGQYGSNVDGGMDSQDFAAQVERAFDNVRTALAAHNLDLSSVVQLRTYIVGCEGPKLGILGQALAKRWGTELPTHTLLGVASLASPDMQFEVDALAVRHA